MYSPKISEELIPVLYRIARSERKPMTTLVNEILRKEIEIMKKAKCLRLRIIRPVFEEIAISEETAKYFKGNSITTSREIYELFSYLSRETKENFIAIHLDTKNKIICVDTISIGSLVSSIVHPREVFKSVLLSSAASIAIVHNHPSGTPEPSRDDINITRRLKEAGDFLGVPVLDHIIIGNGSYISLMEKGYMGKEVTV